MIRVIKYFCLFLLLLLVVGSGALLIYLDTDSFDHWARGKIIAFLESRFPVSARLGRLDVQLFGGIVEIDDLELSYREMPDAPPAISIGHILLDFSLLSYFRPSASLDRLVVVNPELRFVEGRDGRLNLASMFFQKKPGPRKEGGFSFFKLGIKRIELQDGLLLFQDQPLLVDSASEQMSVSMEFDKEQNKYLVDFALDRFELQMTGFQLPQCGLKTQFEFFENRLEFKEIHLQSEALQGEFSGALSNIRNLEYQFQVDVRTDLTKLERPNFKPFVQEGVAHVVGEIDGIRSDFELRGQVEVPAVRIKDMPMRGFSAGIEVTKQGVRVERGKIDYYGGPSELDGFLSWSSRELSSFHVRARDVQLLRVLKRFAPETIVAEGGGDFEGSVHWPGLSFSAIEGGGRALYRGYLRDSRPDSAQAPIRFEGSVQATLGGEAVRLSEGWVRTDATTVSYVGGSTFSGDYSFDFQIDSTTGNEPILMARFAGLAPEELLDKYPLEARGPLDAKLHVDNGTGEMGLSGSADGLGLRLLQASLGHFSSQFSYRDKLLVLENARLTGEDFGIEGRIEVPFRTGDAAVDEATADLVFRNLPVPDFLPLLGAEDYGIGGRASGELKVSWSGDRPLRLSSSLTVSALGLGGHDPGPVSGRLRLENDELRVDPIRGELFGATVGGSLSYSFKSGRYQVAGEMRGLQLDQFAQLSARIPLQGIVNGRLSANGTFEDPRGDIILRSDRILAADQEFRDVALEGVARNRAVEFRMSAAGLGVSIPAEGRISLTQPYEIALETEFKKLPLDSFLSGLTERGLRDTSIAVSGRIAMKGPLLEPEAYELEAVVTELEGESSGYAIKTSQPASLTYRNQQVTLRGLVVSGRNTDLSMDGELKLGDEPQIRLRCTGNGDLRALQPLLEQGTVSGQVDLRIDVVGPLAGPRLVGVAEINNLSLAHPTIPFPVTEGNGQLKFTSNQVSIDQVSVRTPFGNLELAGGVFLDGLSPDRWRINAYGSGLQVEYPKDFSSLVNVDLDFLKSEESQLVSGEIYVRSAEYLQNITLTELVLSVARSQSGPAAPRGGGEILLDLGVEAVRSIRISNNLADVVASGEFRIRGTAQSPVILGDLTLDEGTLFLDNNDYEILTGSVSFNDPTGTRPVLNFEATTDIREYTIFVTIRGPLDQAKFSFRSDPPLSTTSVLTLLAAGQTEEEILGTETPSQGDSGALAFYGAGALLSRTLGEKLTSETGRVLGFETVSIDPFVQGTSGGDPGAKITLGKQITRELNVMYRTTIGSQIQGYSIIGEYKVYDWLTVVGTREEDGSVALDFKFRKRF